MQCEKCVHSRVCVIKCMLSKKTIKSKKTCKKFMPRADVVPRAEVAREIFGELEKKACPLNRIMNQGEPIKWDMLPAVIIKRSDFEELKKKYIHNNPTTPPDIDVNY